MRVDRNFKIILFTILFCTCYASCTKNAVKFNTFPEHSIVSVQSKNGQIVDLGETPLSVGVEDVFGDSNLANILLSHDSYTTESIFISKNDIPAEMSISYKLKKEKTADTAKSVVNSHIIQSVASKIAEAQRYSFNKNFTKAELILRKILDEYPELGVGHDLIANIYYLTNAKAKALFHYRKAQEFSDSSIQREQVIEKLVREL